MNKSAKDKQRRSRQAVKGGTTRLTSPLKAKTAELPEQPPPASLAGHGAAFHRHDLNNFIVPAALIEASGTKQRSHWRPGNLMLTVIVLALIFIAVVAWFVSQMPEK